MHTDPPAAVGARATTGYSDVVLEETIYMRGGYSIRECQLELDGIETSKIIGILILNIFKPWIRAGFDSCRYTERLLTLEWRCGLAYLNFLSRI